MVLIPLIFFTSTASACTYGNDCGFFFEIFWGDGWHQTQTPYSYTLDEYYYFDYPTRSYSGGEYYYFDSGWYGFDNYWTVAPDYYDGYWTAAPDFFDYYAYYPADYYYYGGAWNYSPGWVSTYGPAYYDTFYYPPAYYTSYYNSYGFYPGAATLTGQHYHPQQEAECSDAYLITENVNVEEGENTSTVFYIKNYSGKYLDVENVSVRIGGFDAEARNVSFDKVVKDDSRGEIRFDVYADSGAKSGSFDAEVKVSGTFRDGTHCGQDDLHKDFKVNVKGTAASNSATVSAPKPEPFDNTYYNPQGSTSYYRAEETRQEWQEVQPTGTAPSYQQPEYEPAEQPVYLNTYANTVQTHYGENQQLAESCRGLSIKGESIAVDSGSSNTVYLTVRNYASEDFFIDSVEAIEYNPDFLLEAAGDPTVLFAGSTGAVKVKARGFETAEEASGTAYVRVRGHYGSGLNCTVLSDNFYVRVNGSEKNRIGEVSLNNPKRVEIHGGSGFVTFELENPSSEYVNVRVFSNNVFVSPKEFTFNPKSTGTRTVSLNGLDDEAKVYFETSAEGGEFLTKYTKVLNVGSEPYEITAPESEVVIPVEEAPAPSEGQGGSDVITIVATGFGVIAENAFLLGVLLIVLFALFFLLAK